jgi:hypothetical protein
MEKGRQVSHYIPYILGIIRTSMDGAGQASGGAGSLERTGLRTNSLLNRENTGIFSKFSSRIAERHQ